MTLGFKDGYLLAYNTASLCGWVYVQYLCLKHICSSNVSAYSLYFQSITPLVVLQSAQWMEVVHTLLSLTRSNLSVQICQLGGRYNALMLCFLFASFNKLKVISVEEYVDKYLGFGYVGVLTAWSMAEIIRYPFYICKYLDKSSKLNRMVSWLRYNQFLLLYPIGFAAEMVCWFGLIQFLTLPKNINHQSVNYYFRGWSLRAWGIITFCSTPLVGSYMYYTMLLSRKKYMRSLQKNKKRD